MKQGVSNWFGSTILFMSMAMALHANEVPVTHSATPEAEAQATEESPESTWEQLSLTRKITGFGVLAFLIGWMFWNSNRKSQQPDD